MPTTKTTTSATKPKTTRQLKAKTENIMLTGSAALAAADRELRIRKAAATLLPNIHPADELADIRAEQKRLEKRADELRDQLLADGADLKGDVYTAVLVPGVRETLDRKAITEAFGEAAVKPFIKSTSFVTVKLAGK